MVWKILLLCCIANCAFAQEGLNRFLNVASWNNLLSRSDVRDELELLDSQISSIEKLQKDLRAKLNRAATAPALKIGVAPFEEVRARLIEVEKEGMAELETILLPHPPHFESWKVTDG